MNMPKRLLTLLLAVVMVLSLSACGQQENEEPQMQTSDTQVSSTQAASAKEENTEPN